MSTTVPTQLARRAPYEVMGPLVFVLLWSTGFIGAKLGLPYAEPFTFLGVRFAFAALLLAALALALRAPWPRTPSAIGHCSVVGLLLHTCGLGGVFAAIHLGMSAGLTSLVVGLQPLLTSILGQSLLRERVVLRQWLGLALGLLGVGLVLAEPLLRSERGLLAVSRPALLSALLGLLGGTLGTLYQRRFCRDTPLLGGTSVQFVAACGVALVCAASFETMQISWTPAFVFALGWLVLVLSLGAILLLMLLIRRSSAARVASLFYLVPPLTALEAYLLFDERLGLLALAGMIIAVGGVALVLAQQR